MIGEGFNEKWKQYTGSKAEICKKIEEILWEHGLHYTDPDFCTLCGFLDEYVAVYTYGVFFGIYNTESGEFKFATELDDMFERRHSLMTTIFPKRVKTERGELILAIGDNSDSLPCFYVFESMIQAQRWQGGACLLFTTNKYYKRAMNCSTLNYDERAALVKMLESKHTEDEHAFTETYWQDLITLWNINHRDITLSIHLPIPKYDSAYGLSELMTMVADNDEACNTSGYYGTGNSPIITTGVTTGSNIQYGQSTITDGTNHSPNMQI